jgi:hypothetical protein
MLRQMVPHSCEARVGNRSGARTEICCFPPLPEEPRQRWGARDLLHFLPPSTQPPLSSLRIVVTNAAQMNVHLALHCVSRLHFRGNSSIRTGIHIPIYVLCRALVATIYNPGRNLVCELFVEPYRP